MHIPYMLRYKHLLKNSQLNPAVHKRDNTWWPIGVYLRKWRSVQNSKTNQYKSSHQQSKNKSPSSYLSRFRKSIWQNTTVIPGVGVGTRDRQERPLKKPAGNVILRGERLNAFPWNQEQVRSVCLLLPRLFSAAGCFVQHLLDILARAVRQQKEMKGIHIAEKEEKLPFVWFFA